MKIKQGDLLIINETGTIGFVTNVNVRDGFAIHILKRGKGDPNGKCAWFDFEEATVLVPMSQSLELANKILNSPLREELK